MADANIINFKVYAWNGQEWEFVSRFAPTAEQEARDLAKSLENSEKKQVKILCEAYDKETRSFIERLVYSTHVVSRAPKKKKIQPTTTADALPKVILVIMLALGGALLLARFGTRILSSTEMVSDQDVIRLSFGLFLFLFVLSAFWLGLRVIPRIISGKSVTDDADDFSDEAVSEETGFSGESSRVEKTSLLDKAVLATDAMINSVCTPKDDGEYERQAVQDKAQIEDLLSKRKKEDTGFVLPELSEKSASSDHAGGEGNEKQSKGAESPEKTALQLRQLEDLYAFEVLVVQSATHGTDKSADAYYQFGIRLIVAGALMHVADTNKYTEGEKMATIQRLFEKLGVSSFMTEVFYEKLFEYSQDPVCQPLLEAGGTLFTKFLKDSSSIEIPLSVQEIMSQWIANGPDSQQEKIQASSFFVVMFTDIIGSTSMTQSLGDKSAQHLIHVHNTIVRQALAEYSGREIKMTGDGIMASFTSVPNAIDAAIGIQKAIKFYNAQKKETLLSLRIGLNAGEPIVEGNDLFGTVVQIAARVCNVADKDQIFVSHLIEELALGKPYKFEDRGLQPLKGLSQPQQIFEVVWDK